MSDNTAVVLAGTDSRLLGYVKGLLLSLIVFHLPFLIGKGMFFYILSVIAFAVPLTGSVLYGTAVGKRKKLMTLNESSPFYGLLARRTFPYLVDIVVCAAFSVMLPVAVYLFSSAEYLAFISTAVLAVAASSAYEYAVLKKFRIYKEKAADADANSKSRWIAGVSAVLIYPLLTFAFSRIGNCYISDISALDYSGFVSVIAAVINAFYSISDIVLNTRTASVMTNDSFLALFVIMCQGGVLVIALMSAFRFFFLGRDKLDIIIEPVSEENGKKRIHPALIPAACAIFLAAFIASGSMLVDSSIASAVREKSAAAIEITQVAVDEIDGVLYKEGTRILIDDEKVYFTAKTKAELEEIANEYFDEMTVNVDAYLDWYYSIGGQYSQLWNMIKGIVDRNIEEAIGDLMEEKMAELIVPSHDIAERMETVIAENDELFRQAVGHILDENKIIEKRNEEYIVASSVSLEDLVQANLPSTVFSPSINAAIGVGAGTASGIIIGRIASRSIRSAAGKLAVKAASKPILNKLGGAKIGGAIGTIAGPLGTAVGILGGFIAGEVVSWATIKLDESLNREEYRISIVEDIEIERSQVLSQIEAM